MRLNLFFCSLILLTISAYARDGGGRGFERIDDNRNFESEPIEHAEPIDLRNATQKAEIINNSDGNRSLEDENIEQERNAELGNDKLLNSDDNNRDTLSTADAIARDTDNSAQKVISDFDGLRSGYIYRDGAYWLANGIAQEVAYTAPLGTYAGWSIITQPEYMNYPSYASYPIETAVEVALTEQGYYTGSIDGDINSVQAAIKTFQTTVGITVTGTITPELLRAIGISQPD